jgi:dihydrofolate synthase/folylpolyglutamate synthase
MTPNDPIDWWYGLIDYERRVPQPDDLKLEQMRALLRLVGDPHQRLRTIHVAGSKGKGSTSAMLASVLQHAGYRTGLFTSPHLSDVSERIQTDGVPISRSELEALLMELRDIVSGRLNPTFFEVCTAVGLLHFVRRRVELAVIEVGLGGRFDSTNVVNPLLSIVTSISYDHTKLLGETLDRIAFEKAGILKPGRPAISGVRAPEAMPVIERIAAERRSRLLQIGRDFNYTFEPGRVDQKRPEIRVCTSHRLWPSMELGLWGSHQADNAAVVVAAAEQLRTLGLAIRDVDVANGLASVQWPARIEVMRRNPWVVLDCAHNVASIQALIDTLDESFPPGKRTLIFAASSDKDVPGMLRLLARKFDRILVTRYAHSQRAVAVDQLAAWLRDTEARSIETHSNASEAWMSAWTQAKSDDMIVVTGSVFLAGELRPAIIEAKQKGNH